MSVIVHPLLANPLLLAPPSEPSIQGSAQLFDHGPVGQIYTLKGTINEFIHERINEDSLCEGFYVFNYSQLMNQYLNWKKMLPRIEPYYAVKCNPNPAIVHFLASVGIGFDCASSGEFKMVKQFDVNSSRIIFANPCKLPSHICHAKSLNVSKMTFDNLDELKKIKLYYPEAELLLRILPDDSKSICRFGSKFGAAEDVWPTLYASAKEMGLKIIGISYHVGSGCYSANSFVDALYLARRAFDLGLQYGFDMNLLDIGGGFSGTRSSKPSFEEVAKLIGPLVDILFPTEKIIAEPGRYFAASTMTLATTVHSKRKYKDQEDRTKYLYYIDEGVYGSFNCTVFDHVNPEPQTLDTKTVKEKYESTIFGPTCDSMDLVLKDFMLPEIEVGDWLVFEDMGAYTTCSASDFNGFRTSKMFFVKEAGWS